MFSKSSIGIFTMNYSQQINKLKNEIKSADAIIIGAGAGISTSAGLTYNGCLLYTSNPQSAFPGRKVDRVKWTAPESACRGCRSWAFCLRSRYDI